MNPTSDPWLAVVLVVLFGVLLFLRVKYPSASRRTEAAALAITIVLFFAVCRVFLTSREAPRPADRIMPAQAGR